ncbi:MAG: hypothetical protein JWN08_2142 [Frankiales bacterium]|nr:hypothetical protein [Frankiales bacterium]
MTHYPVTHYPARTVRSGALSARFERGSGVGA